MSAGDHFLMSLDRHRRLQPQRRTVRGRGTPTSALLTRTLAHPADSKRPPHGATAACPAARRRRVSLSEAHRPDTGGPVAANAIGEPLTAFLTRWGSALPPLRVRPDGAITLDPAAAHALPDALRTDWAALGPATVPPALDVPVHLNPANAAAFDIPAADLLDARSQDGRRIEKFSYNPQTGEVLLIHAPQRHATARGDAPPDDYVRGIVLHAARLVLLRPFLPTWAARLGAGRSFDPLRSFDAHLRTRAAIRARASHDWGYFFNATNAILTAHTGRRDW